MNVNCRASALALFAVLFCLSAYSLENQFTTWEEMGRPATSRNIDLRPLERAGKLKSKGQSSFLTSNLGSAQIKLNLKRHSMKLVRITAVNNF